MKQIPVAVQRPVKLPFGSFISRADYFKQGKIDLVGGGGGSYIGNKEEPGADF